MAATLRGTAKNPLGSGTAVSVVLPSGIAAGDEIFVHVGHGNSATHSNVTSGFSSVASAVNGTAFTITTYHKTAAGTEGGTTFSLTLSAGSTRAPVAEVWYDCSFDSAVNTSGTGSGTTSITSPAETATSQPGLAIAVGGGRGAADGTQVTFTAPTGYTNTDQTTTVLTGSSRNIGVSTSRKTMTSTTIASASTTASQNLTYGAYHLYLIDTAAAQEIAVNQVTETGTVNTIAVQQGTLVNQVTETGTVNSIFAQQGTPLGQATETGTVNAVVPQIGAPVAKVTETGTVNSITPVSGTTVDIGQVVEIGTVNAITATQPGLFIAVGQVTETGTVNLITPSYAAGSKRDRLLATLRAQGYTGTVSDMEYARLKAATANDGVGETMRDMVIQNNETNRLW